MSFWKVLPSWGGTIGIVCSIITFAALCGWVLLLIQTPISLLSFILGVLILLTVALLVLLVYWTYGYFNLFYILDRDALRIHWAGSQAVVPLNKIRGLLAGKHVTGKAVGPSLRWPGYQIGQGQVEGLGRVAFYSTQERDNQWFVLTEALAYAISPEDPEGFAQALALRQALGPTQTVSAAVIPPRLLRLTFWSDTLALVFWGAAFAVNLALFGYLCTIFPNLPPILPFHFNALGEVDRLAPAISVFAIPGIGLLGLIINGAVGIAIHAAQRVGTLLLWAGTLVIQTYLWLATVGVIIGQGMR